MIDFSRKKIFFTQKLSEGPLITLVIWNRFVAPFMYFFIHVTCHLTIFFTFWQNGGQMAQLVIHTTDKKRSSSVEVNGSQGSASTNLADIEAEHLPAEMSGVYNVIDREMTPVYNNKIANFATKS